MGEIIKLDKSRIKPIQKNFNLESAKRFLINYLKDPDDIIVPVRNNPYKKGMILLDGHHRSGIIDTLSEIKNIPLYGWFAKSEDDFISNKDLHGKLRIDNYYARQLVLESNHYISQNFGWSIGPFYKSGPENIYEMRKTSEVFSSPESLLTHLLDFEEFEECKKGKSKKLLEKFLGKKRVRPKDFARA